MSMTRAHIVSFGGAFLVGGGCAYFGATIPFKDQWPLYDALRSTSSIIFAVIGAWLTILYPDAIKKIFSRNADFSKDGLKDIELMVSNIRYSTVILAAILFVGIVAQILKHIEWANAHIEFLRAGSFGLLGALTYLQFWSLLMTLAQAEMAREKLTDEAGRKQKISSFTSNAQHLEHDASDQKSGT